MTELEIKLNQILNEKTTKIIPGNIKKDVQIFDITGTLEEWTGDITTSEDYIACDELADEIIGEEEYEELDYIESTGTQYINTDYYPNQNTKIELVMEPIDWGEYKNPFGVRTGVYTNNTWVYTNRFALWLYENKYSYFHIGYNEPSIAYQTNKDYTKVKFHLIVENGRFSIQDLTNNSEAEINTFTPVGNFRTDYPLLLGALTNNGVTILNLCKYKLYSCKIYENNELIKDYIPVKRKSDDKVGLYETKSDMFVFSAGVDDFVEEVII